MVEFDKKDIEAVASNRFMRSHWKLFVGYLVGLVVLMLVIGLMLPTDVALWAKMTVLLTPTLAMYIAGMVWWQRSVKRVTRELIDGCKRTSDLTFRENV